MIYALRVAVISGAFNDGAISHLAIPQPWMRRDLSRDIYPGDFPP
jgi:hypothetical protein